MKQTPKKFKRQITMTAQASYLLYLPPEYASDRKKRWPVLLFLHGAGERGNNLELVKSHGPAKLIKQGQEFPFIVVSPQCPTGEWWRAEVLAALLDEIESRYRVDKRRIYVTGLSMGGYGTWALALTYPHRFAAIAPICGGGHWWTTPRIKHLPTWVFHGTKDSVVPFKRSKEMVDALRQAGGNVRFTRYPGVDHDSWTATYANPKLYEWFLQHQCR
ncbi:MAG: PHB depolymerase family esterase [Verrucomicrobiota bacterium]